MTHAERYLCTISRDEDGRITAIEVTADDLDGRHRHVRVNGNRAAHIAGPLQQVLRAAGLRGWQWTSPEPLELPPTLGAHAELLLRAVKPLQRYRPPGSGGRWGCRDEPRGSQLLARPDPAPSRTQSTARPPQRRNPPMTRPLIEQWLPAADHRRREPARARRLQRPSAHQFPARLVGAASPHGQPSSSTRFALARLAK